MSSILVRNENIPLFEEYFGQLDYDWLLRLTESRKCVQIPPCVIRYVDGNNLSLNFEYRKRDFYMAMLRLDGNIPAMKRQCGSRARFFYKANMPSMARFYFRQSNWDWKTILYYITSYSKIARKWIVKKFGVSG